VRCDTISYTKLTYTARLGTNGLTCLELKAMA